MMIKSFPDDLYRPCVGLALFNATGQVFVGRRIDTKVEAWQLPQGGIDSGETLEQAAWRELGEEVGIDQRHADLIAVLPNWYYYELPENLRQTLWGGKYVGQRQRWAVLRFTGTDADICIDTDIAEFNAWKWAALTAVPEMIVPFKRDLYTRLTQDLEAFTGV